MKPERHSAHNEYDIIIIGAGPVGLMLANLLGQQGRRVLVAEKKTEALQNSMAIGITPPSLHILKELDLDGVFTEQGIPIAQVKVFEQSKLLGHVDFSQLKAQHRFILSLPQSETISILKDNLLKWPTVQVLEGVEFVEYKTTQKNIQVCLKAIKTSARLDYSAAYLVGCDGKRSRVRERAQIPFSGQPYRSSFYMADFTDNTPLNTEAHLYFGPKGSVESFPLPNKRRRWIIQTPKHLETNNAQVGTVIASEVKKRIGINLTASDLQFESQFIPERIQAKAYYKDRILLCGDAAHIMSPIGGQGMNTGFADAAHLAQSLTNALNTPKDAQTVLKRYSTSRRKAFRYAAPRVALGMWMGTRKGTFLSSCRRLFIIHILLHPWIHKRLAAYFAMLTIPDSPIATRGQA